MTNNTNRLHIGLFGRRNAGKSSVLNCLTGQQLAIVSDTPGTTTDPVRKSVEIPGLGPVVLIDTAGIDDVGELGVQRVRKTQQAMKQVDIAIIVCSHNLFDKEEDQLIKKLQQFKIPIIILHNKSDEQPANETFINELKSRYKVDFVDFSAKTGQNLDRVIQLLRQNIPEGFNRKPSLFGDKIKAGDIVLLVTPIDSEAPEGRLILPQVQAIREAIDHHCIAIVLKETEVADFMRRTALSTGSPLKPALVITDSQLFGKIDKMIAPDIPLTSFSILLARQKGDFKAYLNGTPHIDKLQDGDRILLLESCTHHSTCDDIGRVKIPRWLQEYTGRRLEFDVVPGLAEPPRPIHEYALVIQCGGCMITRKQLLNRLQPGIRANIHVTNYGMAIAYIKGSWKRSVELFNGDIKS
ncbi:MAG: [FeFe] hydrogenase H-cluster maturation GTPase HydF [Tannerella sp.]|jgi:[FeFe] hydrogenase H-cluster maturation GTPase HydF|nr:[FeFe] hydrogenase H-cluster maturation GTPase HydF [Tannerella sp.]